jgi:hypothetical protein
MERPPAPTPRPFPAPRAERFSRCGAHRRQTRSGRPTVRYTELAARSAGARELHPLQESTRAGAGRSRIRSYSRLFGAIAALFLVRTLRGWSRQRLAAVAREPA